MSRRRATIEYIYIYESGTFHLCVALLEQGDCLKFCMDFRSRQWQLVKQVVRLATTCRIVAFICDAISAMTGKKLKLGWFTLRMLTMNRRAHLLRFKSFVVF